MTTTEILAAAAPHAPSARGIIAAIANGTNTSFSGAERKALRRVGEIERSDEHRVELYATRAIINVAQAERGAPAALDCARNCIEMMAR